MATLGENRAYFIPILCLAILPMVQFYRLNMLNFEREETLNYVELARSLGFGKWYVQTMHIFRNAVLSVFFQSKKILWFMLSNLFILELLFNINGVTSLLVSYMSPSSFAMALLCLFVPVFIVYSLLELIVERKANRGEVLT
ncbi:ABC transporter permease subunit [Bacillus coahuilensis]|uniref:ABC transporter permease subunit n=1 Tax=Bacillus coahuilensis TaxID=408580 RepID=UPI0009D71FD6|nr:ABC transporter permease subunit [Bacillus coahuilensis]